MNQHIEKLPIPEETLRRWDEVFLPPYDLIYLCSDSVLLPEDIIVMPVEDLKANPTLYNMDVRTTFEPWNVESHVSHVAIIENAQFDRLGEGLQQQLLIMQHDLGRGNLYEWEAVQNLLNDLDPKTQEKSVHLLKQMSFIVQGKRWVSLRKNRWKRLPLEFRNQFLLMVAMDYSENAIKKKFDGVSLHLKPIIQSYVNQFATESGANCFATALAAITSDQQSADWIIHQWIHPQTFLFGLNQRHYEKIADLTDWQCIQLQEEDVIVWVNSDFIPIHATAAISEQHVFNKDGQTLFHPWLIRRFDELATYWNDSILYGGRIYQYRKL